MNMNISFLQGTRPSDEIYPKNKPSKIKLPLTKIPPPPRGGENPKKMATLTVKCTIPEYHDFLKKNNLQRIQDRDFSSFPL